MTFFDRLEQKFGKFAISNLTYFLIGGQLLVFIFSYLNPLAANLFFLQGQLVLLGQWWRVFTFLFMPLTADLFFLAFALYIYYLYGSVLENHWGSFRYFVYIFIAYTGTVMLAFLFPAYRFSNSYIFLSVFLAFAYLYPDFKLNIFFILPIKVKWLAWLSWGGILLSLIAGTMPMRLMTVVSILNFILFFGVDILKSGRLGFWHSAFKTGQALKLEKAHHVCAVCRKNEIDNPDMQIRYCNKCIPPTCYCGDHAVNHQHKKEENFC